MYSYCHISTISREQGPVVMLLVAAAAALLVTTSASYCGTSGVPFSLEVLPNGSPMLGCAQPSCVAQPADDVDDADFNVDSSGQPDGFFRSGDRDRHAFAQTNKFRAQCPGEFGQLACTKKNQWVGGIDYTDHPRQPLVLQCCTFEGLRFSQDVGITTIGIGEAVTGGEVIRDNRQISFDVIANVRKVVDPDDPRAVSYEVTVRRMNCLPDPPEIEAPVDEEVFAEVIRVLGNANNGTHSLGHEGHEHMELEKQMHGHHHPRRKVIQKHTKKRVLLPDPNGGTEPFVGSFGAPIFTPDVTSPRPSPYPRYVAAPSRVTIKMTTTTPMPPPPPQTEPPTQPPNTFTLPTLPPLTFPIFQLAPAPRPVSQAFGVSQASLAPLPPPTHFTLPPMFQTPNYNPFLPQLQPQTQQVYGVGAGGRFELSQPQQYGLTQPQNQFTLPQHQLGLQPQTNYLPGFSPQNPFGFHTTNGLAQPLRVPGLDERPQLVEPVQAPQNQVLGNLFAPPSFGSLSSALNNFRNQG